MLKIVVLLNTFMKKNSFMNRKFKRTDIYNNYKDFSQKKLLMSIKQ